jgi:hypothetical protein
MDGCCLVDVSSIGTEGAVGLDTTVSAAIGTMLFEAQPEAAKARAAAARQARRAKYMTPPERADRSGAAAGRGRAEALRSRTQSNVRDSDHGFTGNEAGASDPRASQRRREQFRRKMGGALAVKPWQSPRDGYAAIGARPPIVKFRAAGAGKWSLVTDPDDLVTGSAPVDRTSQQLRFVSLTQSRGLDAS